MRKAEDWDPAGLKLRYVNPVDGGWAMPTIGTFMQLLPKGFRRLPYRSTDGTVFSVVEGKGKTNVTGHDGAKITFAWGPRDTFVIRAGWHHHEADGSAVVFSFLDRPAQDKLRLWREMRGNQGNGKVLRCAPCRPTRSRRRPLRGEPAQPVVVSRSSARTCRPRSAARRRSISPRSDSSDRLSLPSPIGAPRKAPRATCAVEPRLVGRRGARARGAARCCGQRHGEHAARPRCPV